MMTITASQHRNARRPCRFSTGRSNARSHRPLRCLQKGLSSTNALPCRRNDLFNRRIGAAARPPSAVSSLGGFRTPALGVRAIANHWAGIRNPSQKLKDSMRANLVCYSPESRRHLCLGTRCRNGTRSISLRAENSLVSFFPGQLFRFPLRG